MSKRVAIIDYQMGNMFSVRQACRHVGLLPVITSDKAELMSCDCAILPGVGAFGEAMQNLLRLDLAGPIHDFIQSGRPFMGICLGFQLLFSESEEFGLHRGLGIFDGQVRRFPNKSKVQQSFRVPQVGWNKIKITPSHFTAGSEITPLREIRDNEYMYFVHSYYVTASDSTLVATTTEYADLEYCSSVSRDNVFATQFHPEKSGPEGLKIYQNWNDLLKIQIAMT